MELWWDGKYVDENTSRCYDNAIRIVKSNGTIGATDKSNGAAWFGDCGLPDDIVAPYVTYGSPTDLWGETWTAADINSANFGTALSARRNYFSGSWVLVDAVNITVYYTPPSSFNSISITFGSSSGTITVTPNNSCTSTLAVTVNPEKYVFVTAATTYTVFTIAESDAECQKQATAAGLPGSYKSWMGSGWVNNVSNPPGFTCGWKKKDGTMVANNWADLTDFTLLSPINMDANGNIINDVVWTGQNAQGLPITPGFAGASDCYGWAAYSGVGADNYGGIAGYSYTTDATWSEAYNPWYHMCNSDANWGCGYLSCCDPPDCTDNSCPFPIQHMHYCFQQ